MIKGKGSDITIVEYVEEVNCEKCKGSLKVVGVGNVEGGDILNDSVVVPVRVYCRVCRKSKIIYVFMAGGEFCFTMEIKKEDVPAVIRDYCKN